MDLEYPNCLKTKPKTPQQDLMGGLPTFKQENSYKIQHNRACMAGVN